MKFFILRSFNGYEVALIERTGFRQVYEATKRAHGSMYMAHNACEVYGRGLVDNGHDVVDATHVERREPTADYVAEGLGETIDFCPSDNT